MEAEHVVSAAPQSWADKHYFVIRRLHSLTGLAPLGVFVVVHLLVNASILVGPGEFQKSVGRIHELPVLMAVEVVGILLPLAFHSVLGLFIWFGGKSNAMDYRYGANVRYTLQRISGGVAFVFILYHVWHLHWLGEWFGGSKFVFEHDPASIESARTTAAAIQEAWWIAPFYALGIVATVYHLANGIWTSLITWGVTIKPASQRASGYVCAAFGVALTLVGLGALNGFRTFEDPEGPAAARHAAYEVQSP